MKHKDMDFKQRKELEKKLFNQEIVIAEVFSKEPFIQLNNGLVIYLDEVEE